MAPRSAILGDDVCSDEFQFSAAYNGCLPEEEEEGFYKFLPANTADRLCQSWQSCSNHHEI